MYSLPSVLQKDKQLISFLRLRRRRLSLQLKLTISSSRGEPSARVSACLFISDFRRLLLLWIHLFNAFVFLHKSVFSSFCHLLTLTLTMLPRIGIVKDGESNQTFFSQTLLMSCKVQAYLSPFTDCRVHGSFPVTRVPTSSHLFNI